MNNFLEKTFRLKENNTNIKTEVLAGITTFMTMAYILAVNPNILGCAGMDQGSVLLQEPPWGNFLIEGTPSGCVFFYGCVFLLCFWFWFVIIKAKEVMT